MTRKLLFNRLRWRNILLGLCVMLFLLCLYGNSLWQLFSYQGQGDWSALLTDSYFYHIVIFSFYQAFLSAVLSVILGMMLAHALFYQSFFGKKWLLKLFSLTMVLPVLVIIFGMIGVYGSAGWLSQLLHSLGISWRPNVYGLSGILITHVFFNLPFTAKIFLNNLHSIPNQQRQLAAQLGIVNRDLLLLVEWPYLRQQLLPVFFLVFMLCFTSFAIVLVLGGGPKYTTLEVAIFQAVTFDFELQKVAMLALIQFVICFVLFQVSSYFSKRTPTAINEIGKYSLPLNQPINRIHWVVLGVAIFLIVLPLLQIIVSGMNLVAWKTSLHNPELWKALGYSLIIAPTAGLLCLLMTAALLFSARQFQWFGLEKVGSNMINVGMMILAIPTLVLSVGLFLLLKQYEVGNVTLLFIVVLCNALLAMPFALRILASAFYRNMVYYERLCQSLGIGGWQRWRMIEWQALRQPCRSAFALATAFSLGDFSAIALFGNQDFTALPRLLYQQLGHYRSQEAAVTALILLFFCAVIFLMIENNTDDKSRKRSV
ncbi:MAG: thiamine/thiamine pyrophosphate ABC transporter permease ThiP [Ostreibacterium sp.]